MASFLMTQLLCKYLAYINPVQLDFKISLPIPILIIQQIVTLSKYGHDALDICHP